MIMMLIIVLNDTGISLLHTHCDEVIYSALSLKIYTGSIYYFRMEGHSLAQDNVYANILNLDCEYHLL